MPVSPSTSVVTARTNLPAPSAVAAFDACLHARRRDLTGWTVSTSTGGLRLSDAGQPDRPDAPTSTRQHAGDLEVGRGEVVPVEVELIESRRRCVVAVRPSTPASQASVRAANEAAEALASALEVTVQQWVAAIDDHAGPDR